MEPIPQGTFNLTLEEFEEALRRLDERRAKPAAPVAKAPVKPQPATAPARRKDLIVKWR